MPLDFTLVTAVDAKHLKQLEVALPSWRRNRPELCEVPWCVLFDVDEVAESRIRDVIADAYTVPIKLTCLAWPPRGLTYSNQRDKMLAAYVHAAPSAVKTPWWFKLDTDAVAAHCNQAWLPDSWYTPGAVVIAPAWGYTKPPEQMGLLDIWGNGVPGLQDRPPLCLPYTPQEGKCRHKRFCSWASFYSTAWSVEVASYCPYGWLPVPSQDGYHAYCVLRRGDAWASYPAKRVGWANTPSMKKLKQLAASAVYMGDEPDPESDTREDAA